MEENDCQLCLQDDVEAYTRLCQHLGSYRAASAADLPALPQHVDDPLTRPRARPGNSGVSLYPSSQNIFEPAEYFKRVLCIGTIIQYFTK